MPQHSELKATSPSVLASQPSATKATIPTPEASPLKPSMMLNACVTPDTQNTVKAILRTVCTTPHDAPNGNCKTAPSQSAPASAAPPATINRHLAFTRPVKSSINPTVTTGMAHNKILCPNSITPLVPNTRATKTPEKMPTPPKRLTDFE